MALHVPTCRSERDALIAATALCHGMRVVTRNASDFEGLGVEIVPCLMATHSIEARNSTGCGRDEFNPRIRPTITIRKPIAKNLNSRNQYR
jgi:hypothetical protein